MDYCIIPLAFSVLLLVVANRSYRTSKWPKGKILVTGLSFVVLGLSCTAFWWPILLQALLCGLFTNYRPPSGNLLTPRQYRTACVASTLFVYGLAAVVADHGNRVYVRLRERYPFKSMEERLAGSKPLPAQDLSEGALQRLAQTEQAVDRSAASHASWRSKRLEMLHEDTTMLFVNSAGFGRQRMRFDFPSVKNLAFGDRDPVPQPGDAVTLRRSMDETEPDPPCRYEMGVDDLHEKSIVDFVHRLGFGYFKNRQHVAGFRPHGFSQGPNADQPLRVTSIELVGLLREKPVVYVSENLPRMEELRAAPTRDLDEFEYAGLEALKTGDDLHTRKIEGGMRMLGAIRSTKQCIDCHGGQRGDLLGAFSYMLR